MADTARETSARETWITGIGIVSCLGEGPDVHWRRLNEPPPLPEMQVYAPYMVHTVAPVEFDKQIPKKGDQRQMEAWQRIGTYAAGLALDSAGAHNGERHDLLMLYGFGGHVLKDGFAPVWARAERGGGMVIASLGAFLVLEAREHALARAARPLARLSAVLSDRSNRQGDATKTTLTGMWPTLAPQLASGHTAVISGVSGAEPATSVERAFFATVPEVPVRATGTYVGHASEPQFVLNIT